MFVVEVGGVGRSEFAKIQIAKFTTLRTTENAIIGWVRSVEEAERVREKNPCSSATGNKLDEGDDDIV